MRCAPRTGRDGARRVALFGNVVGRRDIANREGAAAAIPPVSVGARRGTSGGAEARGAETARPG